ncbi:MAG: DEAD/DEAH box helicase, partial [Candidatus Poseidoniales archaeon]
CDHYDTRYGILATNYRASESAIERIKTLNSLGFKIIIWDGQKLLEMGRKIDETATNLKIPYPYQEEAIQSVFEKFNHKNRALVEMATGLGKSIVLAEVAKRYLDADSGRRVLLLAHSVPLLTQLEKSIWSQLPAEIPTHLWHGSEKPTSFEGVTVGMFQSLISDIKKGIKLPAFDLVMVDEAHHSPAHTYREVLNRISKDVIMGTTATPWRNDKQDLREIFGEPVFQMGIIEGMEKGYLSRVNYELYTDDVKWEIVEELSKKNLTIGQLNSKLFIPTRDDELALQIREKWVKLSKPKTITFCKTKQHAQSFSELLNSMGVSSRIFVSDLDTADRAKTINDFENGKFSNIVVVDLLNEGIDVPDVSLIVFARVTHSRRIFVQQLGRGLRIKKGKENLVHVMDFVADIRRAAEALRINREAKERKEKGYEIYMGEGAKIVKFEDQKTESFFDEYLADCADLDERDKVKLEFVDADYFE